MSLVISRQEYMNILSLEGRVGVNSRPPHLPLREGSGRREGGSEPQISELNPRTYKLTHTPPWYKGEGGGCG